MSAVRKKRPEASRDPNGVDRQDKVSGKTRREESVLEHDLDAREKVKSLHKRLMWSRAVRDEAYGGFLAARDRLRALYRQIDIEKDRVQLERRGFSRRNLRVKKQRSALRDMCMSLNISDDDMVWLDAESSDYKHETDSVTEESSEDETITRETLKKPIANRKIHVWICVVRNIMIFYLPLSGLTLLARFQGNLIPLFKYHC
ncbi:hypothetical protein SCHPADRAFT_896957 [Schizopora paradoxa]|uniref:Uncharacterized protein n=1 Tax=Schizopora paradoxa TaxID=27342 RepID=A0A0H2QY85_9AGAM|nr:hypothetical protein SCHPADRAFT_896957 [Schizopora paradoxa]